MKLLRTNNGFYVCEIRGAVFITWVAEKDKSHAQPFNDDDVSKWQEFTYKNTGVDTEIVDA